MKPAQSLALIITSASFIIPFALAQFEVSKSIDQKTGAVGIAACALGHDGCNCSPFGQYGAYILSNATGTELPVASLPADTFSVGRGFCGSTNMYDFYNRSNGIWEFYVDHGNGTALGTCSPTESPPTICINNGSEVYKLLDCQGICSNA